MLVLAFGQAEARAEDLALTSAEWNGLSQLFAIARTEGAVMTPERLDLNQLGPGDALLIVHPTAPLPSAELARFLRSGGRLALADDFGTGAELLAAFGIGMHPPSLAGVRRLRDNPALLLATPARVHALTDGVDALVTNHPQVVYHPDLAPIFALSDRTGAVVLSGAVGKGRLIAISDESVLINNMLEFRGNRTFARNLLHFLRAGHARLYLLDSRARIQTSFRPFDADHPLAELQAALARFARLPLPPLAVTALSIAIAGLLLGAAATSLPRRAAYARRAYLQAPDVPAGMAHRVSSHALSRRGLIHPLSELQSELERRAVERLGLREQPARDALLAGLREAGLRESSVRELAEFLSHIDRLRSAGPEAQPISSRHFSALAASGRRILADLDPAAPPHERYE